MSIEKYREMVEDMLSIGKENINEAGWTFHDQALREDLIDYLEEEIKTANHLEEIL